MHLSRALQRGASSRKALPANEAGARGASSANGHVHSHEDGHSCPECEEGNRSGKLELQPGGQTHVTFGQIASMYDSMIRTEEIVTLISFLKSSIVPRAKGKVLEVSVGTGRTIDLYR